ncbi:MAG: DNA polymerase III subunit beta [bacterium]|nr:DNA polymerase III subunit beta [bacterium]
MKFQCATAALRDAVQLIAPVCPVRTTLAVLSNVHVVAENGNIQLTGTDLDVAVKTSVVADVAKGGATTIPVRLLLDVLRRLNAETIQVSVDENNVATLRAGDKTQCSLRGMAAMDFPKFPQFEGSDKVELAAKDLSEMLRSTSYAVSRDETRYVLNGVCFSFGERFDVVATDGRRLAKYTTTAIKREEPRQLIVPTKSINMLQQMLAADGTVTLRYTTNQLEITTPRATMVTRLIDGHYPNYMQVIPKTCQVAVELSRKAFLDAIGLATVVTEKTKQAVVRLAFERNKLTVTAQTADIGEVNEVLDVKYAAEPMEIAFNPTFLTDVCQNVEADELVMELTNATSPAVVRAGEHFLCVIMPMRV